MLHTELITLYKPFINAGFSYESRFLINKDGIVLSASKKQNSFSIKVEENLIFFLKESMPELSNGLLDSILEKQSKFESKFELKNSLGDLEYYKIIFSLLHKSSDGLIFVQIQNYTKSKETEIRHQKQLRRIESEMVLRTKEILHTGEIINNQGGYLINFLRGLRHDLKSPVVQLKEIIQYYRTTDDKIKKARAAALIDNCLEKLNNTARGFSDFVDVHFFSDIQIERCYFVPFITDMLKILEAEIESCSAIINLKCSKEDFITYNKKDLQSILYNILSNAIKFRNLAIPLIIDISSINLENQTALVIKDNGIGIDLDRYKDQIYEPFKRFNADRPGVGIGLNLVKSLLENRGSSIEIQSKLGVGTEVKLLFKN